MKLDIASLQDDNSRKSNVTLDQIQAKLHQRNSGINKSSIHESITWTETEGSTFSEKRSRDDLNLSDEETVIGSDENLDEPEDFSEDLTDEGYIKPTRDEVDSDDALDYKPGNKIKQEVLLVYQKDKLNRLIDLILRENSKNWIPKIPSLENFKINDCVDQKFIFSRRKSTISTH